jgi:hypothetical protein
MLNEDHIARAATDGFNAHGACARVGVEKNGVLHAGPKHVKQGLAQLVRGGTQIPALQSAQAKTTVCTGNDTHEK